MAEGDKIAAGVFFVRTASDMGDRQTEELE
jgi:hypothetical protein